MAAFYSFSATLIAWTERLRVRMRLKYSIVNARILIDSFSRMRERLLLISTDTDTHYRSAVTHTHTHKHTDTTHYRSGHSAIYHSSED